MTGRKPGRKPKAADRAKEFPIKGNVRPWARAVPVDDYSAKAARARKTTLMNDRAWGKKFAAGDVEARSEMAKLDTIIAAAAAPLSAADAALVSALDRAKHEVIAGRGLPRYLGKALLEYLDAINKYVDQMIAANMVREDAAKGLPVSRGSSAGAATAYTRAAKFFHWSESRVERAYLEPPKFPGPIRRKLAETP